MTSTIGVYDNHELALNAVMELKNSEYPVKHLSIMGRSETEVMDNEMDIEPKPIKTAAVPIGVALGTTLGVLTGIGLFAIPGLGIIMGAGALIGAIAGFDFGLIGGGIAALLINLGIRPEQAKIYHEYLKEGKFLVIVDGNEEEIKQATDILLKHGTYLDLKAQSISDKVNLKNEETKEAEKEDFEYRMNTEFPLSGGEREL